MIDRSRLRQGSQAGLLLGLLALVVAALWWWVVFRQLLLARYITVPRALPCLAAQSSLCQLAQALCGSDHFLGIKRYSVALFWAGAATILASLAARVTATPIDRTA